MSTTESLSRTLVSSIMALAALLHTGCEGAQVPNHGEAEQLAQDVRTKLWAAIAAEGDTYREFRTSILALGKRAIPVLEATREGGTAWQARVMADILIERISKPQADESLSEFWKNLRVPRSRHYEELSVPLAERAADTPMVLVETIWKGAGLRNDRIPPLADQAWVAAALGHMKERRALFPLIEMLTAQYRDLGDLMCVQRAASALGKIGDSRAVLPLCRVSVLYGSESYVAARAVKAILLCADDRTAGNVRRFAERLYDGREKTGLMNIVKLLQERGARGNGQ